MNPMSLARGIIRAAFGDGSGCEPLATGGNPLPQLGAVHEEAVEKETVENHRLRRDGYYYSNSLGWGIDFNYLRGLHMARSSRIIPMAEFGDYIERGEVGVVYV
ncbi:MAG: hypothetical protein RXO23_08645, partial [Vulcanisaeta sp.]